MRLAGPSARSEEEIKRHRGPLSLPRRSRHTSGVGIKLAVGEQAQSSPPSSARTGCGRQARSEAGLPGLQRPARQEAEQALPILGYDHLSGSIPAGVQSHPGAGNGRLSNHLIPGACERYFTGQRALGQCD